MVAVKKSGTSKASARARNERFVEAYLANGQNATEAYLVIKPNVARNSAGAEGHKLLKKPEIQRMLDERRAELRRDSRLNVERVVTEISRVATFDGRTVLDRKGRPLALHKLSDDAAAAVSFEMKANEKGQLVIDKARTPRPSEKNAAMEKAAKMFRLYEAPPPPPPKPGMTETDMREAAKRLAFILARASVAAEKKPLPLPKPE